ncbi:MAG: type II toxin-antitoxin system RelE/ParE family toxin [Candidatus Thiodiazotropha lotti]|uniref:Type II toxin-antitoxin system RelE/ParE family toxin n=1 Tax=Candidatus Thiodiazotropha lotti TaxID=2792787 RepID=A0A9E4K1Y2_9GAMM|nr:type II toxin-antitoxin system RelE/ParE family toxin [Candidatus Thiodiazotropha lotti]MCW4201975.1 type II toxin-antitoxin system RelE/ParE family toxin [Candidatus Thiodiazotropha lotti]
MKGIVFVGYSLEVIRKFPVEIKREAGHQLDRVQHGLDPMDWKPMTSIGQGVREIRIQQEGQWRVIYIAKFDEANYVLHAFRKKTQKTPKPDIEIAKRALKEIVQRFYK